MKVKPYKRISENNAEVARFRKTWAKDIFSQKKVKGVTAVFQNPKTQGWFATDSYTSEIIDEVIEDILTNSRGKLSYVETLETKVFEKKYKKHQRIPEINLFVVLPK